MTSVSQATDKELVDELEARGYSIWKFKFSSVLSESAAKRIRKNRTPLDGPLTDKYALDRWKAAQRRDSE